MWNKGSIQALLDRSDAAVMRGLVVIYDRQTADEQSSDTTKEANGVGFGAFDAEFCSSLARQVQQRGTLSPKQMAMGRNKIKRYWRQLAEVANLGHVPAPELAVEPVNEAAVPATPTRGSSLVAKGDHL